MYDISFTESMALAFLTLKSKFRYILLTFSLELTVRLMLFTMIYEHIRKIINSSPFQSLAPIVKSLYRPHFIVVGLAATIISWFLQAHLISIVRSFMETTGRPSIKLTLRRFGYYVGSGIMYGLALFCVTFFSFWCAGIISLLGLVIFIVGLCFIMGYYRFVPYYSFVTGKFKGAFSSTKRLITGHFLESIKILLLYIVIRFIIEFIEGFVTIFGVYLIFIVINTTVDYIFWIADICFLSTALDSDVVEQMNLAENPAVT